MEKKSEGFQGFQEKFVIFPRLEKLAQALFSLVSFNPEHGYTSNHKHEGASPQLDAELYDKIDTVYHHGKEWDVIRKTRDTE